MPFRNNKESNSQHGHLLKMRVVIDSIDYRKQLTWRNRTSAIIVCTGRQRQRPVAAWNSYIHTTCLYFTANKLNLAHW